MAVSIVSYFTRRTFGLIMLTAAVYFVLAWLSLQVSFQSSNATPVWPPSGWALAALLLLGRRVAPGVLLGAVAVNLVVFLTHNMDTATALASSALIGAGNTGEAMVGYFLLRQLLLRGVKIQEYFQRVSYVFRFLLTAMLMSLVSCIVGAWAVYVAGILQPSQLLAVWFTWWSGDATGVLLFTPLLLAFATRRWQFPALSKKLMEGIILFTGLILVTGTIFHQWFHAPFLLDRSFWVVPFLIWAAVRFQKRVVLTAVMLAGLMSVLGTIRGFGPFANTSLNDALLSVQAFVAVNGITSLLLHAALHERRQIADTLRKSYSNLEGVVAERTEALIRQKLEIEQLIRNILPSEVAQELQTNGRARPKSYEKVSVLFTDFMGFSTMAETMSAEEVVEELSTCFIGFDLIIEKYQLEKIKTIGDSYMCAGGIHSADVDHPFRIIKAALEIREFMKERNKKRVENGLAPLEIRIGVHVGPIVAGVLGTHKYAYDIWGSTVNIASRMESNGIPGEVNISAATYELIKEKFVCRYRGKVSAKNVGNIDMYFVEQEITEPANKTTLEPSPSMSV